MERGSWLMIERGMSVRGADDTALGTVVEVIGEEGSDIFRGITLSKGLFNQDLFVPENHIRAVEDDAVYLDLTQAQARELSPAGQQPATGNATATSATI